MNPLLKLKTDYLRGETKNNFFAATVCTMAGQESGADGAQPQMKANTPLIKALQHLLSSCKSLLYECSLASSSLKSLKSLKSLLKRQPLLNKKDNPGNAATLRLLVAYNIFVNI
jgi:hypothetical protein